MNLLSIKKNALLRMQGMQAPAPTAAESLALVAVVEAADEVARGYMRGITPTAELATLLKAVAMFDSVREASDA